MVGTHAADGSDDAGRGLEIVIRLSPDGRVYLRDITPDLLPVLLAAFPGDQTLQRRAQAAAAFLEVKE